MSTCTPVTGGLTVPIDCTTFWGLVGGLIACFVGLIIVICLVVYCRPNRLTNFAGFAGFNRKPMIVYPQPESTEAWPYRYIPRGPAILPIEINLPPEEIIIPPPQIILPPQARELPRMLVDSDEGPSDSQDWMMVRKKVKTTTERRERYDDDNDSTSDDDDDQLEENYNINMMRQMQFAYGPQQMSNFIMPQPILYETMPQVQPLMIQQPALPVPPPPVAPPPAPAPPQPYNPPPNALFQTNNRSQKNFEWEVQEQNATMNEATCMSYTDTSFNMNFAFEQ